jgi:glycolate oxidase iron-sulfur subunit
MDNARERLEQRRHRSPLQRLAWAAGLGLLTSKAGQRLAAVMLGTSRRLGLQRLAGLGNLPAGIKRLLQLLPTPRSSGPAEVSVSPAVRGKVKLFTGCTGELLDSDTLQATRRLLQRLGYQISIPTRQGCCGALHQHNGRPAKARQLAEANLEAFAGDNEPVLTFATGCAVQLIGYQTRYPQAADFARRVKDIIDYLAEDAASLLRFKPLPEIVALYLPCTQRNVLKQQDTLIKILAQVPELKTVTINPDGGCCGAAGSYMLTQAALSDRLGDAMVERVINSGARILLTSNIGCSLQLGAGLKRRGVDIAVMHPVVLLESLLISPWS